MENFFYEDEFCSDISDLMYALDIDDEGVASLPDDWSITCMGTKHEKMFEFDIDTLMEWINNTHDERFSEDNPEAERIEKLMKEHINFDAINEKMPKLYYPADADITITKADLLEFIK